MEIKCQLDATDCFVIADLIVCSTCFVHHYAHHQELKSIIQVVAACGIWCLVFKLSVWCRAVGCVSGLRGAAASRKPDTRSCQFFTFQLTLDDEFQLNFVQETCNGILNFILF